VRRLGSNTSFCSRAVDNLVKRGWLRKQPKPRDENSIDGVEKPRRVTNHPPRTSLVYKSRADSTMALARSKNSGRRRATTGEK